MELERLTGFDRGTLSEWALKKGMPTERTGARGVGFQVNVRRFVEWREKLAAAEALVNAPVPEGHTWMGIKDPVKIIRAKRDFAMTAKVIGAVAPVDVIEAARERANGVIRQTVMSIPGRIFRDMAGFPDDKVRRWYAQAEKTCRAALAEAQKAEAKVIRDAP
ncbi:MULTISPECIES: hypothetical protein [Methylobacterium]|uniref:hypothetical protein n=1 Tax=Methylobacterium TaxID=407 RepID=UPI0012E82E3F|nr:MULTISPECIES: hypothetical protein [Methylobacterium]MCI9879603.1 hypothetical protein [Methylobacterium goesingense]